MNTAPATTHSREPAGIVDHRPTAVAQRRLLDAMENSPQTVQHKAHTDMLDSSPQVAQHKAVRDRIDSGPRMAAQRMAAPAPRPNNTGLPDDLKEGVESLSGMSMDHVKVHYNASQPAQLNAHAYAQGSDIYVAAGQERHVPHEAWHVVQQAQGRVAPTMQMKGNVLVNDDPGLENEADVMGARALQLHSDNRAAWFAPSATSARIVQALSPKALARPVVQAAFTGFGGGGWAASNTALGAMNAYPAGGNHNAGGQQGGATARTIYLSTTSAYIKPKQLGGFVHFSTRFSNEILTRPTGGARHTHLHVINGQLHGPPTANNLTLGSVGDNNHHKDEAENHIRQGLPSVDGATPYLTQINAHQPFAVIADIAYWNNPGAVVAGSVAAAKGATVAHGGVARPYTHSADAMALGAASNKTHWALYTVNPVYGGVLSPTILKNIAKRYTAMHGNESSDLEINGLPLLNPGKRAAPRLAIANADAAMNATVTAAALAGGVPAILAAGNTATNAFIAPAFLGGPAAAEYATYAANMVTLANDMNDFALWAAQAFPTSLVCDADLYFASYDPANAWKKRSETQHTIDTNRN